MNALFLCVGAAGALAVLLVLIALIRHLQYREKMALAEKGLPLPDPMGSKPLLRWGRIIAGLGLAFTLGLYAIGFSAYTSYPLHLGPWMLGGLIPLFLGLGLVLLHYLIEEE